MTKLSAVVIGTGFGGLAAAIELKKAGVEDITILERRDRVGGVWRENTYPGAACDVPSPYYSFSFEPNPNWPRRFSRQPAILDYLEQVADKHDLYRHIQFGVEVTAIEYDEKAGEWSVQTDRGEVIRTEVVVTAVGQLSRPAFPSIKGRDTFEGPSFHSAEWDHSVDLTGKRVAVIGTGASAIQFVPEIAPTVAKLELFQRTAPYIVPRPDTEFGPRHHKVFAALPFTQLAERGAWWGVAETVSVSFLYSRLLSRAVTGISKWHMRRQVPDAELFEKLWPKYPVGCKRILFSSNYLPALTRPNVDVVTDGIAEITRRGVRTTDGVLHEVDVIVYGTGFTASDFLAPMKILGRERRNLREQWADGAHAYLGISVPHFPNLYIMYGPNTNVGSGSIVFMLEQQARFIVDALAHSKRSGTPIEVKPQVEEAFDTEIQGRLASSVWTKCSSWYRNAAGRVSTNWPGTSLEYRKRTKFSPSDYQIVK